jgi:hypothetical protein
MDCGVGWYWTAAIFEDSVLLQPANGNIGKMISIVIKPNFFTFLPSSSSNSPSDLFHLRVLSSASKTLVSRPVSRSGHAMRVAPIGPNVNEDPSRS